MKREGGAGEVVSVPCFLNGERNEKSYMKITGLGFWINLFVIVTRCLAIDLTCWNGCEVPISYVATLSKVPSGSIELNSRFSLIIVVSLSNIPEPQGAMWHICV